MRLNKYLARSGIASRREADKLIQTTSVTVNGVVEVNPAYRVKSTDKVRYDNQRIKPESNTRIILLNKPNGYITTVKDPLKRKTVMDLIDNNKRLFPVGRLDKDTTGLLLLTNDGELANRLMHPRNQIQRIYKVEIDKKFRSWEIKRMANKVYIGQKQWGHCIASAISGTKTRSTAIDVPHETEIIQFRTYPVWSYCAREHIPR